MGEIVAGFGVSHSPRAPEEVQKAGPSHPLVPLFAHVTEAVEATKPDVLIIFDCDHFNTFFLNNWPIFAIGVSDRTAGPNDGTNMPRYELKGHPALATHIHRYCVEEAGFDLTLLQEFEVDHSIVVPLHFVPPSQSIPIIPIFINGFVPPLPTSQRCHALGQAVRAAVSRLHNRCESGSWQAASSRSRLVAPKSRPAGVKVSPIQAGGCASPN